MARKKIILFIVEGVNDKTCLEGVLEKIIDSNEVRFQITDGDITTKFGMDDTKIRTEIGNIVKGFKDKYHLNTDQFMEVVHIIDTDGLYLDEKNIIYDDVEKAQYYPDGIHTKHVELMKQRNKLKSAIVDRMICISKVLKTVPYSVFYFSSNMDHVFHDNPNLTKQEKETLADEFDERYADNPKDFLNLVCESSFTVNGDYKSSWRFIKQGTNSINRYSNFNIYLKEYYD